MRASTAVLACLLVAGLASQALCRPTPLRSGRRLTQNDGYNYILVGGDGSDLYVQCDTGDDKRCFGTKDRGSATVFTAHYMGPGAAADRYQYEAQGTGLCLNLWGGLLGVPDQKFGLFTCEDKGLNSQIEAFTGFFWRPHMGVVPVNADLSAITGGLVGNSPIGSLMWWTGEGMDNQLSSSTVCRLPWDWQCAWRPVSV